MVIENKKERIVAAAERLFFRNGVKATTIADIAREAHIGKGTVYLEFKSKEEILWHLADIHLTAMLSTISQSTDRTLPPIQKIVMLLRAYVLETYDFMTRWPHAHEIYGAMMIPADGCENRTESNITEAYTMLCSYIIEGQTRGEIILRDPGYLTETIVFFTAPLLPPYCTTLTGREQLAELCNRYADMITAFLTKDI